jgi:ABC-type microcin C transport system permease subunit YejB
MNWQLIFNPFSIFSEKQLAIAGILLTIIGSLIGFYCNGNYNGALDMQLEKIPNLKQPLLQNLINVTTVSILLFITGKSINKKTRIIDILNTALWYRFPLYLISLLSYVLIPSTILNGLIKHDKDNKIIESISNQAILLTFALFVLLFAAYSIVLMTYGFKTSTNTKKWQHWVYFGFTILISEGVSKYFIHLSL